MAGCGVRRYSGARPRRGVARLGSRRWITCGKRRFKALLESRWGSGCKAAWDLILARARVVDSRRRSGLQLPCRGSAQLRQRAGRRGPRGSRTRHELSRPLLVAAPSQGRGGSCPATDRVGCQTRCALQEVSDFGACGVHWLGRQVWRRGVNVESRWPRTSLCTGPSDDAIGGESAAVVPTGSSGPTSRARLAPWRRVIDAPLRRLVFVVPGACASFSPSSRSCLLRPPRRSLPLARTCAWRCGRRARESAVLVS